MPNKKEIKAEPSITLHKIKDIFESKVYIFTLYHSLEGKEYLIQKSKNTKQATCYSKLEYDEERKKKLKRTIELKQIPPSIDAERKYSNYEIRKSIDDLYLKVSEFGGLFNTLQYETYYIKIQNRIT